MSATTTKPFRKATLASRKRKKQTKNKAKVESFAEAFYAKYGKMMSLLSRE